MKERLLRQFGVPAGEAAFSRRVREVVRSGRIGLALDQIYAALSVLDTPLAQLCIETRAVPVTLSGWEGLALSVSRPLPGGETCAALGLFLSARGDGLTAETGAREPVIEDHYYGSSRFPYSTGQIRDIAATAAAGDAPWEDDPAAVLLSGIEASGLAELHQILKHALPTRRSLVPDLRPAAPEDYVAFRLADWVCTLRFHCAVHRALKTRGLPRPVPVIVGSLGAGPFLRTTGRPVVSAAPSGEVVERFESQRLEAHRARIRRAVEDQVASLRHMREVLRQHKSLAPPKWWRDMRRTYEQTEALLLEQTGAQMSRRSGSSWMIDADDAYEAFLDRHLGEQIVQRRHA